MNKPFEIESVYHEIKHILLEQNAANCHLTRQQK